MRRPHDGSDGRRLLRRESAPGCRTGCASTRTGTASGQRASGARALSGCCRSGLERCWSNRGLGRVIAADAGYGEQGLLVARWVSTPTSFPGGPVVAFVRPRADGPSPVAPSCDCLAHRFGNAADNGTRDRRYPTDMTDAEWTVARPLLPVPGWLQGGGGRPEAYCHRAMLDAVRYLERPTRPRTGGIASSRGNSWVTSLRFPPVSRTASGVPCPSVIRWCFEPARPRSTGDGPVWLPLLAL